jgi:hypothetical protein
MQQHGDRAIYSYAMITDECFDTLQMLFSVMRITGYRLHYTNQTSLS